MTPLDRQLRLLRAYALVTYPFACVPFLFPYFQRYGLDAAQYGEVLAAYYAAMFLCEVPTGVLADRFGPKAMLVAGPVLLALGFATLLLWPGYAGFLAAEMLMGLGHAVLSGPPGAILYETLREHGQAPRYLVEEAGQSARRLFGTGAAFLLGGVLVHSTGGAEAAIAATCLGNLAAAAVALRLRPEPGRPALRPREFARQVRTDLAHRPVRWLLAYWVVLFALLRYPFHNYQPYLQAAGELEPLLLDPLFTGALYAALNLAAAPLSRAVPALVARHGRPVWFWAMPMALALSLLVMAAERQAAALGHGHRALAWLGVAMFFAQQIPFGMHWALVQEFVNHRIGPTARTTVLSVLSLGARAAYALANVGLFWLQHAHGMAAALWCAGAGGLVATALVMGRRPAGTLRGRGELL